MWHALGRRPREAGPHDRALALTPTPSELLRTAEQAQAAAHHARDAILADGDPAAAAWIDQAVSAGAETLGNLAELAPILREITGAADEVAIPDSPRALAFMLALLAQAEQRGVFGSAPART